MELSERCIKTLENEGFSSVYEEKRQPGEAFSLGNEGGQLVIFVTEGSLLISVNNEFKEWGPADRLEILPRTTQSATAGQAGCQYVVGEKD